MKTAVRLILCIAVFAVHTNVQAQFFKKLKEKVTQVVATEDEETENSQSRGMTIITHSKTYDTVEIPEISAVKVEQTNEGYRIYGSWWTHEADIYDGFLVEINTKDNLRYDVNPDETIQRTFRIPREAMMKLGYDPMLPYLQNSSSNFKKAVTDEYQNYTVENGKIVVDVLDEGNIQLSFSGDVQLRKIVRKSNKDEDYTETFYKASIRGAVDASNPGYIDNTTITREEKTSEEINWEYTSPSTNQTAPSNTYHFTFETKVKITAPKQGRSHEMAYLLNPSTKYIGVKADMGAYSEGEMNGESIIVMDGNNTHVFVETDGMKMRMSQTMMGQTPNNPTDQMTNYDYSKLTKTGKTKTIIGALCHEYTMSDANTKISLWVAPSVHLPNWFIQNQELLRGHILEYTVESNEGSIKSEVIEINDHINKIINPKKYRKMF